ncbi:Lrp/AsnC family transcriptional regulator [Kitasatospora sp. NBC_01302]|uniref:Lrp/AsnC family transcriptional regulator n=1 Tax=Kitasatospora sp. NBC_01302 TaxID=2903575 RepID=UPI002E12DFC7|nr:Lrp/AsnC family transcriptional regulator [Kitasatospora sp. NBC_01302]WSJ71712.1 Lrp/AsnC family transcriptional regulator [Kitasatospora sp. NBC_01302]
MDRIDRHLLTLLLQDGRATYQELGRQVRLSANTVADRVRRLQAELDLAAFGRGMQMISDIRLRDDTDRRAFERQLADVPQVVSAMRLTGDYDFQVRLACTDAREFETVIDRLKAELGVREVRSRLVLHEVSLGLDRILEP